MTTITKKPVNPTAHLTPEDIEQIGIELDAIRQDVLDSRGASDAAYIRRVIDTQRKIELGSRAVLLFSAFPPAWVLGTLVPASRPFVLYPFFSSGPLLAALIVIPITQGRAGLRAWAASLLKWRVGWHWYAVAISILRTAADELESFALSVARRLELVGQPFVFILAGGIFRAVPWLEEELERRLPVAAPGSWVRRLDREPAIGAVALALQEARGGAMIPAYKLD